MKEKNKGFTLIELLAVIVILALIALIATPIILNVINDAKKQAAKDSFHENGKAVEKDDKKDEETIDVYKDGTAIYYNPETGKKCNESEAVSTPGTKSGCMKWYAFNDKEGNATVNVILDHNTTARVHTSLEADTNNWKNTARLITANEIAKITGHSTFDASKAGQAWFCLDTNKSDTTNYCAKEKGTSKYAWLFDYTIGCTDYGCNVSDSSTYGYWTSTLYKDDTHGAWRVYRDGSLSVGSVSYPAVGIRPVITISKSNIS